MGEESIVIKRFKADGMTCTSCEKLIEKQALKIDGVKRCSADYATQKCEVEFDENKTTLDSIFKKIKEKGYSCSVLDKKKVDDSYTIALDAKLFGWVFGILGILLIGYFVLNFVDGIDLPQISQGMSLGLLFIVGLLTGVHCVSMCGGFVVSYAMKANQEGSKPYKAHLLYGVGKTLSYTIIGAVFGLLGSIITFTPKMRGIAGIIAGLFLLLYGLKMLNIFPVLRKLQFRTPSFITRFVGEESQKQSSPLVLGLLNGLMIACGPLQAMYIMAAGTGSPFEGAKILFVFGLGTLPFMLGFAYITSLISNRMTHKLLKASGAIVIILGLLMMNNGLALTGTGYDLNSIVTGAVTNVQGGALEGRALVITDGFQEIRMNVTRYGWEPDKFILKKGLPVKWIINGKEINGCNNAIQVPKLGLNFDVKKGEQVITFTPDTEGIIPWSCWMGMIPGAFIVKDDIDLTDTAQVQAELANVEVPSGGSCGGSCGSSTCGAASGGSCGCGAR